MSLFIIKNKQKNDTIITIEGSDSFHLNRVLRKKAGDKIRFLDENGYCYNCEIASISTKKTTAKIIHIDKREKASTHKTTLIFPYLKGKKNDFIIQKGTELGVSTFIPYRFKNSVSKPDFKQKKERYEKIIFSACKQSERAIPPTILNELQEISDFETKNNTDDSKMIKILLFAGEKKTTIKNILSEIRDIESNICIAIGPEGGIEISEVEKFRAVGFRTASLGQNILRSETAVIASISMINYHFSL